MKDHNQDIFTLHLAHHMQTKLRHESIALTSGYSNDSG